MIWKVTICHENLVIVINVLECQNKHHLLVFEFCGVETEVFIKGKWGIKAEGVPKKTSFLLQWHWDATVPVVAFPSPIDTGMEQTTVYCKSLGKHCVFDLGKNVLLQ